MTSTKAQELSLDEWNELLRPFGYVDITMRSQPLLGGSAGPLEYDIRVMLTGSLDGREEWAERAYMLGQARQAVEAVQAKGYVLHCAPDIEFGGRYMYRLGTEAPTWIPEARVRFSVGAR